MKQVAFSYGPFDTNAIAATQSWTTATGAYVVINGVDYSQQVQGTVDPASRYAVIPGVQRTIGVFSTGNLSAVVFYASGVDTTGRVVTASFAGASGGSSTASDSFATFSGVEFHRINYIYATSAATSAFTVGVGATGSTRWFQTSNWADPVNIGVTVVTSTGRAVTLQNTANDPNVSTSPTTFDHATGSLTANTQTSYTVPVSFVRAIVTTATGGGSGNTQIMFNQAGV